MVVEILPVGVKFILIDLISLFVEFRLVLGGVHLDFHGLFASFGVSDEEFLVSDWVGRRTLGDDGRLLWHSLRWLGLLFWFLFLGFGLRLWLFWLGRWLIRFLLLFLKSFRCSFFLLFLCFSLIFIALFEHLAHHIDSHIGLVWLTLLTAGWSFGILGFLFRLLFLRLRLLLRFFLLWLGLVLWLLFFWFRFIFWFLRWL